VVDLFQRVMDATDLSFFPDHYFNMVTDKVALPFPLEKAKKNNSCFNQQGCLDCFINGAGRVLDPS